MTHSRSIWLPGLLAIGWLVSFSQESKQKNILVNIQVREENNNQITPVMVCITSLKDGQPRIPPFGETPGSLFMTQRIYRNGIDFKSNKKWIGPVRKMSGMGNNDDRSYVYELLPSLPYWKEPVLYQTSGDFTIYLPPGKFRISLEHGNEFIPVIQDFTVSKKDKRQSLNIVMKRWINLPDLGWFSGDVHVHHPTLKPGSKEYLIKYARAEDVHLVNLLEQGDHKVLEGSLQEGFGEKFRLCQENFCLISGQEDPSSRFGHIMGLNINQLVRDTVTYHYYDLVFRKLHQQPGALVGFAHFSWNGCDLPRGFPWLVTTNEIDFVELLQFAKINTLDYYDYLNLGFRLTAAAGSDFPWGSTLGEVRTFVYTGKNFSADSWFESLKSGKTFVTNGPVLFLTADQQLPGAEIFKTVGSTTELKVTAISHKGIGTINRLAIYNNDGLVAQKLNPMAKDSLEINLTHTLSQSQWLAAMVTCDNGAVAHTTPVYFVVNRKPTWSKSQAPQIIEKQLKAIQTVEEEERAKGPMDIGILQRLNNARDFYKILHSQINDQ